jgi:hypothetical protein
MAPNPTGLILRSGAWRRVSKDGPTRRLVCGSWSILRGLCLRQRAPQDEAGGQGFHR